MADLAVALRERLGFCLRVARSSVPHREAGNGLWLEGRAPLGSVVALYPGVVYSSEQYRFIPGYPAIDKGNSYIVGRYDGAVIDAKPWGAGDPAGGSPAHFANHPPAGAEPNVVVASLDAFPARLGALRRYVPNVTYAELSAATDAAAADADPAVPALCFVATRDLEDEELLLNYRYSPHVRRPSWYVPVDAEEDERRWD
uniref:SET domain-containing protein n=2 Tax=Tetraselmis sp. GSL018 TaxID=582737 RepID=A0A061RI89_9CHLO